MQGQAARGWAVGGASAGVGNSGDKEVPEVGPLGGEWTVGWGSARKVELEVPSLQPSHPSDPPGLCRAL